VNRALAIVLQVTSALEAAHALGIVHRDLKPDNLLLMSSAASDYIKVLDFGIAKLPTPADSADKPLTLAGMVYGTPEYMAPEQALGQQVDGRADIYALGVIFFEMLAGRRPYVGPVVGLLGQQLSKPLPRISELARTYVPLAVEELLADMLAAEPHKRIADVKLLMNRLVQLEGMLAAELSARAHAPARRGRWWVVGAAVLGLIVAGFFVGRLHKQAQAPRPALLLVPPPAADEAPDENDDDMARLIRQAKEQGVRALLALAQAHPGEGIVQAELALEYALSKQFEPALQAASAALALDPKLNENPKVAGALFRAAQAHEVRAATFRLLVGPMGAAGVNIIYDLAHTPGVQARVRAEAGQLLQRQEIRQAAAPSLRLILDLESAQSCAEIAPLVRRAGVVGDRRALPRLQEFSRTTGCDPKEQGDCYACLRGDNDLAQAIATIRQRSPLSDGSAGP
jgi:serine/threonine-protein kinase